MTEEQWVPVRSSCAGVAPDAAAAAFDARLLELDPVLRTLFTGDMAARGRKLMAMFGTAIANPHDLGAVIPAIEQLGVRRAGCGVTDRDFDIVGSEWRRLATQRSDDLLALRMPLFQCSV